MLCPTHIRNALVAAAITLTAALNAGCEAQSPPGKAGQEHSDHAEHTRSVELSAGAIGNTRIETGEVAVGSLRDNVQATATVKHDISRVAHITPLVEGQITEISAALGEDVEEGQVLARMRSVALGEARSAVNEARARLEVTRENFQRQKKLRDKGIASERSFIEARGALDQARARYDAAGSRLRALGVSSGNGPTYPLKSHISGTIIEQHASLGETKGPQDELFVVADQTRVWVIGRVAEQDAHAVHTGMGAVVTLDAYPEKTWEGSIAWVASTIDKTTRRLPIRVELDNPEGHLKPGMFGTIRLSAADAKRTVPLVPIDAVQHLDGEQVVFIPGEHDGEFIAQRVQTGAESDGHVEVIDGLAKDAVIVTRGAFDVKAALTAQHRSAAHQH
ncbi:MAG: efflux RND transporter periplasmic adaptor subunit [Myxococcota bacterium]